MERLLDHLFKGQEPRAAFSSQTSCMRRGEVRSLQTRKDAFFSSCHVFTKHQEGVFFQQFPMMVVPQEHGHHFYWKTQRGVLLIMKKQPQTKGGGLLSSADLISMSCSGKFGLFLFGWTLTTVPSFLQCCNWARASSQCIFCNQFAVAQVLHFQT